MCSVKVEDITMFNNSDDDIIPADYLANTSLFLLKPIGPYGPLGLMLLQIFKNLCPLGSPLVYPSSESNCVSWRHISSQPLESILSLI
jgi:hypothetical protein